MLTISAAYRARRLPYLLYGTPSTLYSKHFYSAVMGDVVGHHLDVARPILL